MFVIRLLTSVVACLSSPSMVLSAAVQADSSLHSIVNGDFEQASGQLPDGWMLIPAGEASGVKFALDRDSPGAGQQSLQVDSTEVADAGRSFANCMQSLDATGWRGKRVRLRAAVRTADLAGDARAQL